VGDTWSHEVMFRKRPEPWVKVDYMKLCVDRDLKCGDIWLQEAVSRKGPALWVTVSHMKLCVDRDLNCG